MKLVTEDSRRSKTVGRVSPLDSPGKAALRRASEEYPKDVEALYFLGAAEGIESAFAAGVERKFMSAFRSGTDAVEHHRAVLSGRAILHACC